MNVIPSFGTIAKAIVGFVLIGLIAYQGVNKDGLVTASEWATLLGAAVVNGVLVYFLPLFPSRVARYAKAIATAVVAVLTYLATVWLSGFLINESIVIEALVQMILASGLVAVTPNAGISAGLGPGHGLEHYDDLTDTQYGSWSHAADDSTSKAGAEVHEGEPYLPERYQRMTEAEPDGPITDVPPDADPRS